MNHSNRKCSCDPFTCDKSEFKELFYVSEGKIKRWVVCTDYYKNEFGRLIECDKHNRIEDEVTVLVKKGELCIKAPLDWWEEYLKGGGNDMG